MMCQGYKCGAYWAPMLIAEVLVVKTMAVQRFAPVCIILVVMMQNSNRRLATMAWMK